MLTFGVHKSTTSNCAIFALKRFWTRGGYLIIRRSSYGWWPHVFWSPNLIDFEEFTTDDKFHRWSPPALFKGFVQTWTPSTTPPVKVEVQDEP